MLFFKFSGRWTVWLYTFFVGAILHAWSTMNSIPTPKNVKGNGVTIRIQRSITSLSVRTLKNTLRRECYLSSTIMLTWLHGFNPQSLQMAILVVLRAFTRYTWSKSTGSFGSEGNASESSNLWINIPICIRMRYTILGIVPIVLLVNTQLIWTEGKRHLNQTLARKILPNISRISNSEENIGEMRDLVY